MRMAQGGSSRENEGRLAREDSNDQKWHLPLTAYQKRSMVVAVTGGEGDCLAGAEKLQW